MLFNSHEFLFLFLPVTVLIFFQLGERGYQQLALGWLVVASFFFYGWWNPAYLTLLSVSIFVNYVLGALLAGDLELPFSRKCLLVLGIVFNLVLFAFFKRQREELEEIFRSIFVFT